MEINSFMQEDKKNRRIELRDQDKILRIFYAGNLDLYMNLQTRDLLPEEEDAEISFDINKSEKRVYPIIEKLYEDVIQGKIFDDISKRDMERNKESYYYKDLVDEESNIHWISDDGPRDIEDELVIQKTNDNIKLTFKRKKEAYEERLRSGYVISIRISTSGSRYQYFFVPFMKMYQNLQEIEFDKQEGYQKKKV